MEVGDEVVFIGDEATRKRFGWNDAMSKGMKGTGILVRKITVTSWEVKLPENLGTFNYHMDDLRLVETYSHIPVHYFPCN